MVAAAWAPPGTGPRRNPVLLAALSGQSYLVAVHLVDPPPGLTAQLLPVALPELQRGGGGGGVARGRCERGREGRRKAFWVRAQDVAAAIDPQWQARSPPELKPRPLLERRLGCR